MPQGFAKWKALLRYFFVVSFISLAFKLPPGITEILT